MGKENKKLRAVIYCRMATDNDTAQEMEMQKEMLCRYAEQNGYTVIEKIGEAAKGNTLRRKGIQRIYQLGCNGEMDVVLVENSSRIVRSGLLLVKFCNKLTGYGVKVISRKEGLLSEACSPFACGAEECLTDKSC